MLQRTRRNLARRLKAAIMQKSRGTARYAMPLRFGARSASRCHRCRWVRFMLALLKTPLSCCGFFAYLVGRKCLKSSGRLCTQIAVREALAASGRAKHSTARSSSEMIRRAGCVCDRHSCPSIAVSSAPTVTGGAGIPIRELDSRWRYQKSTNSRSLLGRHFFELM